MKDNGPGVPDDLLPLDSARVRCYVNQMRASGRLTVTNSARSVARHLLYPPLGDPTRPGAWLNRLATLGLLPPSIREAYGLPWTPRHERAFRIVASAIRRLLPLTPPPLRYWSAARRSG